MRKSGSVHEDRSLNGVAVPSSDLGREAVAEISEELRHLLADVFALYVKTKNFHWHMTGREFRDYHLLLDEQAEQIFVDDRRRGGAGAQDRGYRPPLDLRHR